MSHSKSSLTEKLESDVKNDIMQRWKLSQSAKEFESKDGGVFVQPNLPQLKPRYTQSDQDIDETDEYAADDFTQEEVSERLDAGGSSNYEDDFERSETIGDERPFTLATMTSESSSTFQRQISKDEYLSTPALSPRDYEESDDGHAEEEGKLDLHRETNRTFQPLNLTEPAVANLEEGTGFQRQMTKDEYTATPVMSPRDYEASDDGDDDAVNVLNDNEDDNLKKEVAPSTQRLPEHSAERISVLSTSLRASTVGALADLAQWVEESHPSVPPSRISVHHESTLDRAKETSTCIMPPNISGKLPLISARDEVDQLEDEMKRAALNDATPMPQESEKTAVVTTVAPAAPTSTSPTRASHPITSEHSRLSLLRKKLQSTTTSNPPVDSKPKTKVSSQSIANASSPPRNSFKSPHVTPSKLPKFSSVLSPSSVSGTPASFAAATASFGGRTRMKQTRTGLEGVASPSRIPVKKRPTPTAAPVQSSVGTSTAISTELLSSNLEGKMKDEELPPASEDPSQNKIPSGLSTQNAIDSADSTLPQSDSVALPEIGQLSSTVFVERERMLRDEITQLKAMLFEQQYVPLHTEATAVTQPTVIPEHGPAPVERFVPKSAVVGVDGVSVIVSRADYDRLLREAEAQELLMRGYETENRRLYALMKSKEAEETLKKAAYFDERRALNVELNRLRNQQHKAVPPADTSDPILPKSTSFAGVASSASDADRLRRELALEIAVRDLKDELASAKDGTMRREEGLQSTIEKLRSENSQLREEASHLSSKIAALNSQEESQESLKKERSQLLTVISDLKGKVLWYSENQVLIEKVQASRAHLSAAVTALKKELTKLGYRQETIAKLISEASKTAKVSSGDESILETEIDSTVIQSPSPSMRNKTSSVHRHPADAKKIRELERTIAELKESITKKNPNSLATLIQASSLTASFQGRKEEQLEQLAQQQREAAQVKADYELRLRSLRQEHEKVKMQYEQRVQRLEKLVENSHLYASKGSKETGSATGSESNVSNATTRIHALEEELERVRTFYSRKVEEVQRKAEQKVQFYKRGTKMQPAGQDDNSDGKNDTSSSQNAQDETDNVIGLEMELARVLEELSIANTRLESQAQQIRQLQSLNSIDKETHGESMPINTVADDELPNDTRESTVNRQAEVNQLQAALEETRTELIVVKKAYSEMLEQEQHRNAQLVGEVELLRHQLAEKPKQFQLQQFLMMEAQVRNLELKFMRREHDLQRTVDEIRAASKMERSRIAALHQQEIREKDEQLIRLRDELDHIMTALEVKDLRSRTLPAPTLTPRGEFESITL